jgi:hypothetical protein
MVVGEAAEAGGAEQGWCDGRCYEGCVREQEGVLAGSWRGQKVCWLEGPEGVLVGGARRCVGWRGQKVCGRVEGLMH